jgi:glycosyltransferase involved in cell wall biosynthesis
MTQKQIAVVVSGFPRRSETFATNELLALEERGALAAIFATKPGDGSTLQPGHERLLPLLKVLPNGTPVAQGASVAALLNGQKVDAVHGYFAHKPAEVAMHAAAQLRVPFGFSVHARDARKLTADELTRRAQKAACVVACNTDVAATMQQARANAHLIPHGVDLRRFKVAPPPTDRPFRMLAVGRLVEKKGFRYLIEAASQFKFSFSLRIVGDGPEQERLAKLISRHGLSDQVTLLGSKTHDELPREYANAHVVVVPSIMDHTGDRDGLPNVVLEAMASGRPVVASEAGAIRSGVAHRQTGLLVAPKYSAVLASALTELAYDSQLQETLGRNARQRVERDYELTRCTERFCQLLEHAYA